MTEPRTVPDSAAQMRFLCDELCPNAAVIRVVLDNLNTHTLGSLFTSFPPDKARRLAARFEVHYTPKHGSWPDLAEAELSVLSRQGLDRQIDDDETLAREIAAWERQRNETGATINWQFTAPDARIKLKRLYPSIQDG